MRKIEEEHQAKLRVIFESKKAMMRVPYPGYDGCRHYFTVVGHASDPDDILYKCRCGALLWCSMGMWV